MGSCDFEEFVVIIDMKSGRPACAILMAAMGGGVGSRALHAIGVEHWLTYPPEDAEWVRAAGTLEEWTLYGEGLTARKEDT